MNFKLGNEKTFYSDRFVWKKAQYLNLFKIKGGGTADSNLLSAPRADPRPIENLNFVCAVPREVPRLLPALAQNIFLSFKFCYYCSEKSFWKVQNGNICLWKKETKLRKLLDEQATCSGNKDNRTRKMVIWFEFWFVKYIWM